MGVVEKVKNVRGQKAKSTPIKNYVFEFSQKFPEELNKIEELKEQFQNLMSPEEEFKDSFDFLNAPVEEAEKFINAEIGLSPI